MKTLNIATMILIVIGALNWGLVALGRFDLVAFVFGMGFGQTSILSRLVYALVGLSAIYQTGLLIHSLRCHHPEHAAA
jgi:uncharacterized protein